MSTVFSLYIPGTSGIHRCDARIKLLLLCFLSIALFLVKTWWGIGLGALVIATSILFAKLPLLRFVKMSLPLLVLLVFIWICNAFTFDITQVSHASVDLRALWWDGSQLLFGVLLALIRKDA